MELSQSLDLLAFRLYFDGGLKAGGQLSRIAHAPLAEHMREIVFVCGHKLDLVPHILGPRFLVCSASEFMQKYCCSHQRHRRFAVVLGSGKQGFNKVWALLLYFVQCVDEVRCFMLSDSDEQIPMQQLGSIEFQADVLVPMRETRQFGRISQPRRVMEDLENSFVKLACSQCRGIRDIQSGVFAFERKIVAELDLASLGDGKWGGDLWIIAECMKRKACFQTPTVPTGEHRQSTLFESANEPAIFMSAISVQKLQELVDFYRLSFNEVVCAFFNDLENERELSYGDWNAECENLQQMQELVSTVVESYRSMAAELRLPLVPRRVVR